MTRPSPTFIRRLALPLAIAAGLAGCSTLEVKPQVVEKLKTTKKGPESAPHRSITSFSSALRCMDNMMIDYGVRDLSMLVEEIADSTKKVNAGTRDMLISAMSVMTQRSRATRVVAFGKDTLNLITFNQNAQRQNAYDVTPAYDIKGSVTQWDENVIRNQKDLGIGVQPYVNLGASRDAAASILGLDLSVLSTSDMSVIPGVTSRNSVVIFKQGQGVDGDAAYKKFGISFSMTFNQSEGQSQALRGLVELAVIELMGKLTKLPYWKCLGANETDDDVKLEMSDWFYSMASNSGEIIAWFQNQLRHRRFYAGPIDGRFSPAIDEAIANYRAALGMSKEAVIDQAFFFAFLDADHSKVKAPSKAAQFEENGTPTPTASAPVAPTAATTIPAPAAPVASAQSSGPLRLALATANNRQQFAKGEPINLVVNTTGDAYVYCYLQDEAAKITRFFPNRFTKDALVPASTTLALPGTSRFKLFMNNKGLKETIACFATPRDVLSTLPAQVVGRDLEPLPVASLDQVREAFQNVSSGSLAQEIFHVNAAK
ncbi:MAG: DUF4384 domain-containing protein [Burkholderiales bacterium]